MVVKGNDIPQVKRKTKRELKTDRISFVLDKELTPILKTIAIKSKKSQSKLIQDVVLKIIMDNVDLLDDKEQVATVLKMISVKNRGF